MPSEYEALVAALANTGIPFAEYGWKTRPEGTYGVVSLDFESGELAGDTRKQDREWEASIDLFCATLGERAEKASAIETVLNDICGAGWEMNSIQYETETGLFHYEWVCRVKGTITAPKPAAQNEGTGS